MKRRFLPILLILALCLGLLPVTALAEGTAPQTLYVGSTTISAGYWTSSDGGTTWARQENQPEGNNYIYYDGQGTLKLHNATIQGGSITGLAPFGSGIYALSSSNQPVTLTIELIGENTITGTFGIYVNATPPTTPGTDASLVIKKSGDNGDNGSLTVTGTGNSGLHIISGTGDASLTIKNASVDAKTTQTYSSYAGVCVQSGASATGSPQLSLAVDGGSLTASGTGNSDGILFYVGSSQATGATTSLTVADNAIVRAKNGIKAERVDKPTPSGAGIVFDGTEGTVYGDVALQTDLEIGEGESLTIPEGSSLAIPDDKTLTVNGGELTGNVPQSGVVYKVTEVTLDKSNLIFDVGESSTLAATITPSNATEKSVTWSSSDLGVALVNNGVVTAVAPGTATITATADGKSATCTVTVTAKPSPDRPVITRPSAVRISGDDRFETAMETADQLKKELGVTEFSAIVVACSDDFADALSASAFAHEKEAPILVVNENNEERVKTYIEQNLAKDGTVYIMGGSAAVTGGFEDSLSDFDTVRFAGDDRYETNLNTLKELNLTGKEDIIIASGKDFADALSASSTGCPIMIVGERLTESQIEFLKTLGGDDTYCIAGGTAAVSKEVEEQLRALNAGSVKRLAGEDRYETGVLIAETFYGRTGSVYIASGDDFPDGLTGGVLAGLSRDGKGAPLILVNGNNTERAAEYIYDVNPRSVKAIGGKTAVPDDVLKAVIS